MTDKLKCPFCGAELTGHEDAYGNISDIWFDCPNEECEHAWTTFRFDVWQALIDGKKAQDALNRAISWLETIATIEMGCATSNTAAKEALGEITSITKQEE